MATFLFRTFAYMPNLPFPSNNWIANLADTFWREATVAQIEKDFALQAIPLVINTILDKSADFLSFFAEQIEALNLVHHPRFVSLLYQLDMPEESISKKLREALPDDIYTILAEAIALQCFRKVWWRQQMK